MNQFDQFIYFIGSVVLVVAVFQLIIWAFKGLSSVIPEKFLNTIIRTIFGIISLSGLIGFIYYLWLALN